MSDEGTKLLLIVSSIVYWACVVFLVVNNVEDTLETSQSVMIMVGWIVFIIIVFTIARGFRTKCKKCGKMFAYQVYDHNIVDVSDTTITEEKDIRNKRGEKIGSYTQDVAATAYTTKQYLRCKYCGHETTGYVVNTYKK